MDYLKITMARELKIWGGKLGYKRNFQNPVEILRFRVSKIEFNLNSWLSVEIESEEEWV